MKQEAIFKMAVSRIYPYYIQKAEKKGRTKEEVDTIFRWLTGYDQAGLDKVLNSNIDFETFFLKAPQYNPNAEKITGVVCGVRVEEIANSLMRKIRNIDKLIDELAKGRPLEKILRK